MFLEHIRAALKSGEFRPEPVRQVMIPKKSGKLRKLGITTVADRVVQAALKLVLEPIFEADFQPCSYGFRPNRRAHDAIAEIHFYATRGYEWVLEADIRACFDEIGHVALMDRLRARITDKRVCALVKAFLKAGVMTADGDLEESYTGAPQGGILSPLLANIALSALDDHFTRQWQTQMGTQVQRAKRKRHGQGNWRLVRYADDFVVMVSGQRHHAEVLREEVAAVLAPLGLRLAEEKTRVVHIDEGFDFLSFTIRRMRKRGTSKHYVYTVPSKKAIQAVKDKVSAKTYRATRNMEPEVLIQGINRTLAGWANYYRHGVSKAVFSASTTTRGTASCAGYGTSTNPGAPASACQNYAGASANPAPGGSHATGSGSPAHPACRSPATATAAAPSRPRGHPSRRQHPAKPSGQDTWRARCGESRTPGSAGGPGKPTRSNPGRAPWSDPDHGVRVRGEEGGRPGQSLLLGACPHGISSGPGTRTLPS